MSTPFQPPPSFLTAPTFSSSPSIPSFTSAPSLIPSTPSFTGVNAGEIALSIENLEQDTSSSSGDDKKGERSSKSQRHSHSKLTEEKKNSKRKRSRSRERHKEKHQYKDQSHSHKKSRNRQRDRSKNRQKEKERDEKEKKKAKETKRKRDELKNEIATSQSKYDIFYTDKKGDPNNVIYGGLYKYDIPLYRRANGGRVLGLPHTFKIVIQGAYDGKSIQVVQYKRNKELIRYIDPKYTWQETDKSLKRLAIRSRAPVSTLSEDFIAIEEVSSKDQEASLEQPDYRIIDEPQNNNEKGQDEEEEGESIEEFVKRRTIDFNRELDESPSSVKLWLSFISFQESAAAQLNTATNHSTNKATRASVSEVKISIFEKAIEKCKDVDGREAEGFEKLLVGYLQCCSDVYDTVKILTKWDQTLKAYPHHFSLWTEYINFRQTNFASFTFSQCLLVFEESLSNLRSAAWKTSSEGNKEKRESIEHIMLYIFLRACLFMKQSGFTERAHAAFQALIEVNFFQPDRFLHANVNSEREYEHMLKDFEKFWESEVARFGEEGAAGWHATLENSLVPSELERTSRENSLDLMDVEGGGYEQWVTWETLKETSCHLSARTTSRESDVENDPYRIVLFEDVRPMLFVLTHLEPRIHIIYALFVFLGLPFLPPNIPTTTPFATDCFTHNELASDILAVRKFWPPSTISDPTKLISYVGGVSMEPEKQDSVRNPFGFPLRSYPMTVDELFASEGQWFCAIEEVDLENVQQSFVRNALTQLRRVVHNDYLSLCFLTFESLINKKDGQKLAKQILEKERTNLILWNGYAQMEKAHNRFSEARKVYTMALAMSKSLSSEQRINAYLLYRMFAEMELELGRREAALHILTAMSEESGRLEDDESKVTSSPSPTKLLKARKFFTQESSRLSTLAATESEYSNSAHLHVCHALFEYLSQGIEAACEVFERILGTLEAAGAGRSIDAEILYIAYAKLLYRHTTFGGPFKPRILGAVLDKALNEFPNNTILLGIFLWNEAKTKIEGRVKRFMSKILENQPSHLMWTFALYAELHQNQYYNVHLIRSLLERAIDCTKSKSSLALWKLYIWFEIQQKNSSKAKILFFRAIRECPWAKDIYLLPFSPDLIGQFSQKELDDVFGLMMEKELRIRVPVENFLEGRIDENAQNDMEERNEEEEDVQ